MNPTNTMTIHGWLLRGFLFIHIEVGLVSQPLRLLHINWRMPIAYLIINPVVHKGIITFVECTGELRYGQTGGSSLLNSSLVHLPLLLGFALTLARTGNGFNWYELLQRGSLLPRHSRSRGIGTFLPSASRLEATSNVILLYCAPVWDHLWTRRMSLLMLNSTIRVSTNWTNSSGDMLTTDNRTDCGMDGWSMVMQEHNRSLEREKLVKDA
jgi:hypothetical protein